MTLEELRKIKSSQYVFYNGTVAYLYISTDGKYYIFSNETSLHGSDSYPAVRSALGFSYSYWLASEVRCDPCNKHKYITIPNERRRPI